MNCFGSPYAPVTDCSAAASIAARSAGLWPQAPALLPAAAGAAGAGAAGAGGGGTAAACAGAGACAGAAAGCCAPSCGP